MIKQLAWNDDGEDARAASGFNSTYEILHVSGTWTIFLEFVGLSPFRSISEAKAAAQADYEQRVLAAIVPSPALEANQQLIAANLSNDDMALVERLDSYMGLADVQDVLRDCRAAVKLMRSFSAKEPRS